MKTAKQDHAESCTSKHQPNACAMARTGEAGEAGSSGLPALLAVQRREADQRAHAAQAGVGHPEAAAQLQLLQPAQAAKSRQLLACVCALSDISPVPSLAPGWCLGQPSLPSALGVLLQCWCPQDVMRCP